MIREDSMNALSCLVAATLLTTPPDVPEPAPAADDWPAVQEPLQKPAAEGGMLDPGESRYVRARPEDVENDLNLLRRRYQDLKCAPKLNDCTRFPDRGPVNELLAFNRTYRRHLDARQPLEQDRCDGLRAALQETD